MAHKSFSEMIDTLRVGVAAGMSCQITLAPDAAGELAGILEKHRERLRWEAVMELDVTNEFRVTLLDS
jgi:hypothetical protein